jgi:phytoene synthase
MSPPYVAYQPAATSAFRRTDVVSGVDSSTFGEGVRLLPRQIQADVRRLYLVLRAIDDLVDDNHPEATERVEAVERWATGEQVVTAETRVLSELSKRHSMKPLPLLEFCAGMRHDIAGRRIDTEADLERYCQQAGGSVGVMLAEWLGTTHPEGKKKMAALGRATQRTNILRDIDEDRASGRVYIAQTTIARFGLPEPGAREELLRDQIARADRLYEEGIDVIPTLVDGREAMGLATALYREILRQLERDGFGREAGRATIPDWRRHQLIAQHSRHAVRSPQGHTPCHVQPIELPRRSCMPDP